MRWIISCRDCQRQYEVRGRAVGDSLRCHCGTRLVVESPRGHDARVVRCSSCGAAREANNSACGFCHSDFTLHEQDLHTVCPQCLARVSDKARFCHSCGVRIDPEPLSEEATELNCPACDGGRRMRNRTFRSHGVSALECSLCGGLWLSIPAFRQLAEGARDDAVLERLVRPTENRTQSAGQAGRFYRPCAYCQKLMVRKHYGQRSGVVVDICRDHGVWFDNDELQRLLDWLGSGGRIDELIPSFTTLATEPRALGASSAFARDETRLLEFLLDKLGTMFVRIR